MKKFLSASAIIWKL